MYIFLWSFAPSLQLYALTRDINHSMYTISWFSSFILYILYIYIFFLSFLYLFSYDFNHLKQSFHHNLRHWLRFSSLIIITKSIYLWYRNCRWLYFTDLWYEIYMLKLKAQNSVIFSDLADTQENLNNIVKCCVDIDLSNINSAETRQAKYELKEVRTTFIKKWIFKRVTSNIHNYNNVYMYILLYTCKYSAKFNALVMNMNTLWRNWMLYLQSHVLPC